MEVTALFMACQSGHGEVVRLLLASSGIDVNQATTDDGRTPLWMACHDGHAPIVKLLLASSEIDVNQAATNGFTPLFMACQKCHLEVVQLLVSEGADKEKVRSDGATPLLMACQNGHLNVVQLLVSEGATTPATANRVARMPHVVTGACYPWRIIEASAAFTELTGYSREECVGSTLGLLLGVIHTSQTDAHAPGLDITFPWRA